MWNRRAVLVGLLVPVVLALGPLIGMLLASEAVLVPPASSVARLAALVTGCMALIYLLLLRRRSAAAASNLVALPVLAICLYPLAYVVVGDLPAGREAPFAVTYLGGALALAFVVHRLSESDSLVVHRLLAVVALVFGLFSLATVARLYIRPPSTTPAVAAAIDRILAPLAIPASPHSTPDVYHLVLDGMGRPDILSRDFGLDINSQLTEFRRLGFRVDRDVGHANYVQTQLSLSSMLNATHPAELFDVLKTSQSRAPLHDLISRSRVPAAFKRLGYRVEFIGSGYLSSGAFESADVCHCPQLWFADAEFGALSLTPFRTLVGGIGNHAHYKRSLAVFQEFESPRSGDTPRYVFAHAAIPHPPFVVDDRGRFTSPSRLSSGGDGTWFSGTREEYTAGYRAQASFTLDRALLSARRVIEAGARDGRVVVIIISGDHGPRLDFDAVEPTVQQGQRVLPTLLAIRWPDPQFSADQPVSLVNVYRALFRRLFAMDLPNLPDTGYISSFDSPYDLRPVGLVSNESGGTPDAGRRD